MKDFIKKIKINKNLLFLTLLLILGVFLRFYHFEKLMTFLGDEGRDMLIVMDILKGRNFPLIGPPTSVGTLYLGPIYYYFIAPFAWIFKMNPVGPAVFVALLGVFTIPLVYFVGKIIFNSSVGLLAAAFYTVSPLIVKFSRSSWNPNPMPFFSLLLILFLFYWQKSKKAKFLYLSIISFAIMLQLHYMALLLTPLVIFLILFLGKKVKDKRIFILCFGLFVFLMSPLLVFDLKHNFVNSRGILEIFKIRSQDGFSLFDLLSRTRDRIRQLFSLFFTFQERSLKTNLVVLLALFSLFFNFLRQKKEVKLIFYGIFIWGLLMIGLYRGSVYPHYLGFLFPWPALLMGNSLIKIFNRSKLLKIISLGLFLMLFSNMLKKTWLDLNSTPVVNVKLVKKIVLLIKKESKERPFNFALLAKNNYDSSYRYLFKLMSIPAVYQTEVTKQLFVVCEDQELCHPEGNPKWEIALFDSAYKGKIKKAGEWKPDPLIKVFKFIPK